MNAVAWIVIAGLSLWPFGDKNDDADVKTIDSLDRQKPVLVEKDNPDASGQSAIQNYREFLRLYPDAPELRAEAMRRLADLQLEAGEERMIEGEKSTDIHGYEYRDLGVRRKKQFLLEDEQIAIERQHLLLEILYVLVETTKFFAVAAVDRGRLFLRRACGGHAQHQYQA